MAKNTLGSWHTWRTARRRHRCTSERHTADCLHTIEPGTRYVRSALAPGREMGNVGWWNANLCTPCANYYSNVPTDPMVEAP